jgi:HlyD family secretion protein
MRSRWARMAVFIGLPLLATALCTIVSLRGPVDVKVSSASVTVGDIVRHIVTTGVLQPVTTVDVGTQVSGTIEEVDADYNAIVRVGQVLLRLDSGAYQATLDQARAAQTQARAEVAEARNAADDAASKLTRAESLAARNLIPQSDLDDARTAMAQADADVQSASAKAAEAAADVSRATVSLRQTIIRSPVDGVVMSRNVDAGATVAALQSAPVLFQIATDFRSMQIVADVDESDIAAIRVGAPARFQVETYPRDTFEGHVAEIRLDAVRDQPGSDGPTPRTDNQPVTGPAVVSYPVIINVANPDEKLRPGMTAVVSFDGARREHATRIPNAALSFTPSAQVLEASKQKPPAALSQPAGDGAPTAARVWAYDGTEFTPIPIRIGLADDQWTELVSGPLEAGLALVTNATTGGASAN